MISRYFTLAAAMMSLSAPALSAQDSVVVTVQTVDMNQALCPTIKSLKSQFISMTNESKGLTLMMHYKAPEGISLKKYDGNTNILAGEILEGNDFTLIPTSQSYYDSTLNRPDNEMDSCIFTGSFPSTHEGFIHSVVRIKYTEGTISSPVIPLESIGGQFHCLDINFNYEHFIDKNRASLRLSYERSIKHHNKFVFLNAKGEEMKPSGYQGFPAQGKKEIAYYFKDEAPSGIQIVLDNNPSHEGHTVQLHYFTGAENLQEGYLESPVQCETAQIFSEVTPNIKMKSNRAVLLFTGDEEGELLIDENQSVQILSSDGKVIVENAPLSVYRNRHVPIPFKKPYTVELPLMPDDVHELIIQGTIKMKLKGVSSKAETMPIDFSKPIRVNAGGLDYQIEAQPELDSGIWKLIKISSATKPSAAFATTLPFQFLNAAGKPIHAIKVLNESDKTTGAFFKFRNEYPAQLQIKGSDEEQAIELPIKQKVYFGMSIYLPELRNEIPAYKRNKLEK